MSASALSDSTSMELNGVNHIPFVRYYVLWGASYVLIGVYERISSLKMRTYSDDFSSKMVFNLNDFQRSLQKYSVVSPSKQILLSLISSHLEMVY